MADNGSKVFNDPIHGNIELHPILVKIIDTPQFQRLRNLKQLGGTYYVYPGASHNRFEHSIGVAHLAGELLQTLKEKQPGLGIDKRDILCVQIAGLCHDLGHGPFSHMFDQMFIPKARPNHKWSHEKASQDMFDHLVEKNHLIGDMKKHGLVPKEDRLFIKELIDPPKVEKIAKWPHHGRPKEKAFLYEVVSNTRNKIDVDKWEYFARDCHQLGMQNNFDCHRLIKFARVCKVGGMMQICYRDKEVFNLYNMFYTRFSLHKRAYQHKVSNSIEWMIGDAFLEADKHIQIEGKDGKMFTLSTAIDDMVAYTKLTDAIFDHILTSSCVELQEARKILERIMQRKLYECLGEFSSEESEDDMKNLWNAHVGERNPDDYVVELVKYNYGMGKEDPIKHVRFYKKKTPHVATPIDKAEVSLLLPERFEEKKFRIYTKRTNDEDVEADRRIFGTFGPAHPVQAGGSNHGTGSEASDPRLE
ncbi:deoxynucleoside triphosphate triphosphohydrolase SAMHD1-like isoform X2 [Xiphophorus maculatus]|uniref:Deoxynucleoside triphosphate triphosphohydrolase SAMHD1-like n=1 Tax=Xiphophorus maculatus TaxID=8083 RepID=M3ZZ14_XIPMA|nr:deoxynucleoside triphosphate triphosphohydrolase SAMHD1-like isoform X2 [Xiphophorus maculatus]